jgi:hypothetical protein
MNEISSKGGSYCDQVAENQVQDEHDLRLHDPKYTLKSTKMANKSTHCQYWI